MQKSIKLFRDLLRLTRQLPRQSRQYYVVHIREGFAAHADEEDPERIDEIVRKAYEDAEWILQKYKK